VRVHTLAELSERIDEQGLNPKHYQEYLDLRRYGHAPTSGMGLGIDRVLCWLLDVDNIRDIVTWPRVPGKVEP
jgi:asparaginyl-tRNA synthetase